MKARKIVLLILVIFVCIGLFNIFKPLPKGLSVSGTEFMVPNQSIAFLSDKTHFNEESGVIVDQEIFDEVFQMIENAEHYILLDLFLYNNFQGKSKEAIRSLSSELTTALVNKKKTQPGIEIIFITDPINQIYGEIEAENIKSLKEAVIIVTETNLKKLRDSNPIYSAIWRPLLQYLPVGFIKLPNPFVFEGQKVGLDTYFKLLNFKANHRKVVVADYIDEQGNLKMASLVTSANPHDGSSAHGNVAIKINDFIWQDIIVSEKAVADFSDKVFISPSNKYQDANGEVLVQLLTEQKIKKSLINSIKQTKEGDKIKMAMFYLSDRNVINSLKSAFKKGVDIEIILDPNKDAFGRGKNGVPNVSVAKELKKLDEQFKIRWCNTHGEQCHSKLTIVSIGDKTDMFIGSANLTKRNIGDYNLETNIKISGKTREVTAITDALNYFADLWTNNLNDYTVSYPEYEDKSVLKTLQYRIMEKTGLSSF